MMLRGHKQTTNASRPNGEWPACGVGSFGLNACPFSLSKYLQLNGNNRINRINSAQPRDYRHLQ